jgi:hypothetical protein
MAAPFSDGAHSMTAPVSRLLPCPKVGGTRSPTKSIRRKGLCLRWPPPSPLSKNREPGKKPRHLSGGSKFWVSKGKAPKSPHKYLEPWRCVPPPLIDDLGAARLLGITLDTLNRIGEEELPRLRLGRCRRYWLDDVLNYARREGAKKNFKGRAEVIGEILDDVRGRSQRRRRTSE